MPSPLRPVVFDSRVHLTHRLSSCDRPLRMHDPRLPHESPSGSQCRIFALLEPTTSCAASATTMSQSSFPSIVSRLHTPLPPPLRVPQAESDKTEARIWWLSFIAGCIIVLPFC